MFDFFGGPLHKHVLNSTLDLGPVSGIRNDLDFMVEQPIDNLDQVLHENIGF